MMKFVRIYANPLELCSEINYVSSLVAAAKYRFLLQR